MSDLEKTVAPDTFIIGAIQRTNWHCRRRPGYLLARGLEPLARRSDRNKPPCERSKYHQVIKNEFFAGLKLSLHQILCCEIHRIKQVPTDRQF